MRIKTKSFASAVAITFVLLFFGPAASKAYAWHGFPHAAFHGRAPFHHGFGFGNHHRTFFRPFVPFRDRPFFFRPRPFHLVRFFTYVPYPHWAFRRDYCSPAVGPYGSPY